MSSWATVEQRARVAADTIRYVDELEKHVKDPGSKHKDFWKCR
jgi:hypothetical protein